MENTITNFNNSTYVPSQNFLEHLQQKIIENNVEIEKDIIKNRNRASINYDLACKKVLLREAEHEYRKAQYDKVSVNSEGTIIVTTQNTMLKPTPRELTNFRNPRLTKFVPVDVHNLYIYLFECEIDGKVVNVFLDGLKIGSHTYIRNKLSSAGCDFLLNRKGDEKELILGLWAYLLNNCCRTKIIPKNHGWFKINGKLVFCKKGEATWEILQMKL